MHLSLSIDEDAKSFSKRSRGARPGNGTLCSNDKSASTSLSDRASFTENSRVAHISLLEKRLFSLLASSLSRDTLVPRPAVIFYRLIDDTNNNISVVTVYILDSRLRGHDTAAFC